MNSRWEYAQLRFTRTDPCAGQATKDEYHWSDSTGTTLRYESENDPGTGNWNTTRYDASGKVIVVEDSERNDWINLLNEMGADGWEMVSERSLNAAFAAHSTGGSYTVAAPISILVTFKRQVD